MISGYPKRYQEQSLPKSENSVPLLKVKEGRYINSFGNQPSGSSINGNYEHSEYSYAKNITVFTVKENMNWAIIFNHKFLRSPLGYLHKLNVI